MLITCALLGVSIYLLLLSVQRYIKLSIRLVQNPNSKTRFNRPLKKKTRNGFKTDHRLMQVKSAAECSNSAILLTFIKLPFVINNFVLSNFDCLLKTSGVNKFP